MDTKDQPAPKSIAAAKRRCKELIGRQPRCGYEVSLGQYKEGTVWLVNEAGRLRIRIAYP